MNNARTVASGVSQRARKTTKSKVVFKPVLDNPFLIAWPEISPNVQTSLLDEAVALFSCLREYHIERGMKSRKRKRASTKDRSLKRIRLSKEADAANFVVEKKGMTVEPATTSLQKMEPILEDPKIIPEPEMLQHINFGINEVAKFLERHISTIQESLLDKKSIEDGRPTPLVLFACRWDINPPNLLAHFPHLVASANTLASTYQAYFPGSHPIPEVKLVNLPKGAENPLSEALGMRRVSVVVLNSNVVLSTKMDGLLKVVPRLATPWLIPTTNPTVLVPRLEPTHIKHLRTTAPTDMRVAKQERVEARKVAKQQRKKEVATIRPPQDASNGQMAIDK